MLRIRDAYENGIDTLEEYKNHKERLEKEKEELEIRLYELKGKQALEEEAKKRQLTSRLQNAFDLLSDPDADNETKGNALRSVMKKIIYDKEENKLKFYYYISS